MSVETVHPHDAYGLREALLNEGGCVVQLERHSHSRIAAVLTTRSPAAPDSRPPDRTVQRLEDHPIAGLGSPEGTTDRFVRDDVLGLCDEATFPNRDDVVVLLEDRAVFAERDPREVAEKLQEDTGVARVVIVTDQEDTDA